MQSAKRQARKLLITVLGSIVLVAGIIMIPYPGPGWVVVFAGLAILASEYEWAQNILDKAKAHYEAWQEWLKGQSATIQFFVVALTGVVVVFTLWILNVYGLIDNFLGLHWQWLHSPFHLFE